MTDDKFDNIKLQFEQFLTSVGNVLSHEKELHLIQNKLRRHFNNTASSYLCTTDFQSLLSYVHDLFNENNKATKFFKLLNLFDEQLKKHAIKLVGSRRSSSETSSSTHHIESPNRTDSTDEKTEIPSCQSSLTISLKSLSSTGDEHITSTSKIERTDLCDNIFFALNETPLPLTTTECQTATDSDIELRRKNKIVKLERRLNSLATVIRELEGKDLSLDEMLYSNLYEVESKLKKQAYDIYTKLAVLKNESPSTERILDEPIILIDTEIDHPLINKALEDMVNQTKFLPSFGDVLSVVEKTNDEHELNLGDDGLKNIAEKALKIIGEKIKTRRMADFRDIMSSRLPEDFDLEQDDPALNNVEIENTLTENERTAEAKTQKIMEEFSKIDPDLESEKSTVESDDDDEEEEEEEKGEEDEDDDDDEIDSQSDTNIDLSDNKSVHNDYDVVDIIPPFSSESSTSTPSNTIETIHDKDPVAATVEISSNDRILKILSTASIPVKRTIHPTFVSTTQKPTPEVFTIPDDDDNDDIEESQSVSIVQEHTVHTNTPQRRRQQQPVSEKNETMCRIYRQRITTNDLSTIPKRTLPEIDLPKSKKPKEITEVVILD